jgi:hypothetical protein
MASVGNLAVEMSLNQAKFTGDLGKVVASVDNAAKKMRSSLNNVVSGFVGGIAAALSVRAFVGIIQGAIDSADRLNDLSQSTGIAVETLGGLGFAAAQSGTDLEGVAKAVNKLNLQIAAGKSGNEEAIQTFKALGISVADLRTLSNDEVLFRVADRYAEWADGANKAAIGNRLFGKSFAENTPFLNQGGDVLRENIEYFKRYGGITKEVAANADKFNDTIEKVNLLNRAFAITLANALLPMLDSLAERFVTASEEGDGFKDTAETLASVIRGLAVVAVTVAHGIDSIGKSIGVTAAQAAAVARLEFASAAEMGREFEAEQTARTARFRKTLEAILNPSSVANAPPKPKRGPKPDAPNIADGAVDDVAKRVLDGQLRALQNAIGEEADLLKIRERFLQDYFRDDVLAFAEYFDTRRGLIADNLAKEVAAYDQQIALLREAQKKLSKGSDRADIENKIADVVAKRSKAEQKAAVETIELFREQDKEAQKFRDTIERVSIELAQMSGDTAMAALASFDLANRELLKLIDVKRKSSDEDERREAEIGARLLANLRARTAAQAGLNEIQDRFRQSLDTLAITQQNIALDRKSGQITEIDSLNAISAANRAILPELKQWEANMAAIVATTSDPQMAAALEQLRLQIKSIEGETDLLGDKFQSIFRDSFADSLASVIDGTKSAKDALKDFADTVVQQISRIAANNIADALFGKSGPGGGIGGFFSSLFGGGGGGGGFGDFFGSLFGGGFADGGFPPVGKMSLVGERGPELIMPRSATQVIPNHALGGKSVSVTNQFVISGPMDKRSQSQIAAAAYMGVMKGQRNL